MKSLFWDSTEPNRFLIEEGAHRVFVEYLTVARNYTKDNWLSLSERGALNMYYFQSYVAGAAAQVRLEQLSLLTNEI